MFTFPNQIETMRKKCRVNSFIKLVEGARIKDQEFEKCTECTHVGSI